MRDRAGFSSESGKESVLGNSAGHGAEELRFRLDGNTKICSTTGFDVSRTAVIQASYPPSSPQPSDGHRPGATKSFQGCHEEDIT